MHEGTLLSEEAAQQGFETESWTIDSGEAPRERDWISAQKEVQAEVYFSTEKAALNAGETLSRLSGIRIGSVVEQVQEDWDAQWKASFTGAQVPPFWAVLPPWVDAQADPLKQILRLNPGAGFGTGTHETTQLCLEIMGRVFGRTPALKGKRVLDFGSGSGILAIGAALLGASVIGVEIDPLAIDNAEENASLNQLTTELRFQKNLPEEQGFDLIIANILRPVLIEFASQLLERLSSSGTLILSGLMEPDLTTILSTFQPLVDAKLGTLSPKILALNEWRAVAWTRSSWDSVHS